MLSREDKDWISALLKASEERTASLIATEVGNLHSDIVGVEGRLTTRLESIDARLKLQADQSQLNWPGLIRA
jgi:hypothetical protein